MARNDNQVVMIGKYKGYTIELTEWQDEGGLAGKYAIKKDEKYFNTADTIKKAKAKIDRIISKKFKRVNAFVISNFQLEIWDVSVTSVVDEYGNMRVVYKDPKAPKSRDVTSRMYSGYVYADTKKNRKIAERIISLKQKVSELESRIADLDAKLVEVTKRDVIIDYNEETDE